MVAFSSVLHSHDLSVSLMVSGRYFRFNRSELVIFSGFIFHVNLDYEEYREGENRKREQERWGKGKKWMGVRGRTNVPHVSQVETCLSSEQF